MWHLAASLAQWREDKWEAAVDLTAPQRGLRLTRWEGRPSVNVAALAWQVPVPRDLRLDQVDAYVRGRDLVVTFGADESDVRTQIYWRVLSTDSAFQGPAFEAIVSVQTDRLDSQPRVITTTRLPPGDVVWAHDSPQNGFQRWTPPPLGGKLPSLASSESLVLLARPRDGDYSYFEMMLPGDWADARWDDQSDQRDGIGWQVHWRLDSLEKGVIRRCRARCGWSLRGEDERVALNHWRAFMSSPLPLTV